MAENEDTLTPERRNMLAEKARVLYRKFCGTGGRGICAESFAVYHIERGETVVAEDLLAYLDEVIAELMRSDPHNRLVVTRELSARIRRHLSEAPDLQDVPHPSLQKKVQPCELCLDQVR